MSSNHSSNDFALVKENFRIILAGVILLVLGFILMSGGASKDPNVFEYQEVFSPLRITVAPLICLVGYLVVMVGILKTPKQSS